MRGQEGGALCEGYIGRSGLLSQGETLRKDQSFDEVSDAGVQLLLALQNPELGTPAIRSSRLNLPGGHTGSRATSLPREIRRPFHRGRRHDCLRLPR